MSLKIRLFALALISGALAFVATPAISGQTYKNYSDCFQQRLYSQCYTVCIQSSQPSCHTCVDQVDAYCKALFPGQN